jgi:hypothetical protein
MTMNPLPTLRRSIHNLAALGISGLLMAGCVPPPRNFGDFVMQTSLKMPRGNHVLSSPEWSTGDESKRQEFTARNLPLAIDPLAFEFAGTIDPDDAGGLPRSGTLEIRAYTFPKRELIGTALWRGIGKIDRERTGDIKLAKDFTLMIRTKEAFKPNANLRLTYLLKLSGDPPAR